MGEIVHLLARLTPGNFAVLLVAALLYGLGACVWTLRRRTVDVRMKRLLAALFAAALLASPFTVAAIIRLRTARIDAPQVLLWIPAIFVAALLAVSRLLFPPGMGREMVWSRRLAVVAFLDAFLNLANWCAPGWCGRFGFPFAYSWWSDGMIIMNGENLSAGNSWTAVVWDAAVFVAIALFMGWRYRRAPAFVIFNARNTQT